MTLKAMSCFFHYRISRSSLSQFLETQIRKETYNDAGIGPQVDNVADSAQNLQLEAL